MGDPVKSSLTTLALLLLIGCPTQPSDKDGVVDDGQVDDNTDTDTDTDTDPVDAVPVTVESSGVITCADPSLREEKVFDMRNATRNHLRVGSDMNLIGGALGVADFTGDGAYEVYVPGDGVNQIWQLNEEGGYDEVGEAHFSAELDLTSASGSSIADVDGDGDLDLFVTRFEKTNVLLINDGAGHFTDGTLAAGLLNTPTLSLSSTWGDMDADGDLDLFVGSYGPHPEKVFLDSGDVFETGEPSLLYQNNGDGTFTDISERLPAAVQDAHVFMASWQDLNGDMQPELLTIHDFGWYRPGQLLWNDGGDLVADDGAAGFNIEFAGMGLGVGDINDDLVPDFVQSSWRDISLLTSAGGSWWESAPARNLLVEWETSPFRIFGWGTELADIDIDGDLDVVMNFGHWTEYQEYERPQLDAVWLQDDAGNYTLDIANEWGVDDRQVSRGLVVTDLNDDGWPDILKKFLDGPTRMYLSRCGEGTWLKVNVRGLDANTHAIGSQVIVTSESGSQIRWISAGGTSMFSAGPPEVLFGLAGATKVDVEITWPDGTVATLQDVDANQTITVTPNPDTTD